MLYVILLLLLLKNTGVRAPGASVHVVGEVVRSYKYIFYSSEVLSVC